MERYRTKEITENDIHRLADGKLPNGIEDGYTIVMHRGIGFAKIKAYNGEMVEMQRIVEIPIGREGSIEFKDNEIVPYPTHLIIDDKAWRKMERKRKRKNLRKNIKKYFVRIKELFIFAHQK